MKEETNKIKLVRIEERLDDLLLGFGNHLEHHKKLYDRLFRIFLVGLGIGLTAITTIAVTLILKSG